MAKKDENIYYCVGCGKTHPKGNFYVSYSPNHANGRLFYCKDFIKGKVYDIDGSLNIEKFKKILRELNVAFLYDVFESALESKQDTIGTYFRIYNSLPQNRGYTWDNSVFATESEDMIKNEDAYINENNVNRKMTIDEKNQLENKWGLGYSDIELLLFEKKYNMLINNYKIKTAMHKEALLNYIRYRVKEEIATAEGNVKEAKEWGALASKAATDAKINPSQLSKADLSGGLSTFSELSEAVEKEVDIIPILPQFKYRPNDALDFNIWCYVNYIQDLMGLPMSDYDELYKFYDERVEDYVAQYGDPYGIFDDDPSVKNRDNIKQFIREDD